MMIVDDFRKFFKSRFLTIFDVDDDVKEKDSTMTRSS